MNVEKMEIILATDCGSTTTKARLFRKIGDEYRFVFSGEAPTTVEAPYEDVTMGVRNAVREIEELSGIKILSEDGIIKRKTSEEAGIDLYVTTSSAGGGLQMMVFGATQSITGESAHRAALGGGAIVMDVISVDDGVPIYKKVRRTRHLRPDIVLMAGGTDGGASRPVIQTAEILRIAEPKARFGADYELPVIFAGNKNVREQVEKILDKFALSIVDNLRPVVELENTDPARNAIQLLFMEHVMSHAPGYDKLMKWTEVPIMPTPMGEGMMFQTMADMWKINVIGVGLGGATTNIYSIFDERFVRTVSANLGMSYSICNVLRETGMKNILRWMPFDVDEDTLGDILTDKMIRPTSLPQTLEELIIEHSVAREALRLGMIHHKFLAKGLRGVRPPDSLDNILERTVEGAESYIDMLRIHLVGGTGGLLSHAPRRVQSALILMDGFQPEGITTLVQDSVFMMPHLGVLSTVHKKAVMNIFEKDCLVRLGTCIAPKGLPSRQEKEVMTVDMVMPDGSNRSETLDLGDLIRVPLDVGEIATVKITPSKDCDVGAGMGHTLESKVEGGIAGILLDARGRPVQTPEDRTEMKKLLLKWFKSVDMYSLDVLSNIEGSVM
ncbi:MAG: glutamate mutase L [Candidatus Bathyarchaeota archaeon]|nr:MAG: glutamate mutase L [Candidatus Bathyarchaeota archaeon]